MARSRLSGHSQLAFRDTLGPSGSRDIPARDPWAVVKVVPELPTKAHAASITQSGPEIAPPHCALIHSLGRDSPSPYTLPESRNHRSDADGTHNPPQITLPPFSVLSFLLFPRIPSEPRVPLSFLAAERFQLSDSALGELDMKLYVSRIC